MSGAKCTIFGAEGDDYVIDAPALRHGAGAESGHRVVHFAPLTAPYARPMAAFETPRTLLHPVFTAPA